MGQKDDGVAQAQKMERAVSSQGGSGNNSARRNDTRDRRRTVSGAIPNALVSPHNDQVPVLDAMHSPWTSPSAPPSPTTLGPPPPLNQSSAGNPPSHKRTFSNNILSKFNFLRNNGASIGRPPSREQRPVSREKEATSPTNSLFIRKSVDDDVAVSDAPSSPPKDDRGGALSSALKQGKTRKRKGSLRKTALLGGRKSGVEGRERKGSLSLLQRSSNTVKTQGHQRPDLPTEEDAGLRESTSPSLDKLSLQDEQIYAQDHSDPQSIRRHFSYESAVASSSSDSAWSEPAAVSQARLALLTDHQIQISPSRTKAAVHRSPTNLESPLDPKSPTSQASYTSTTTTDDESEPLALAPTTKAPPPPISTSSTSYFPPTPSTHSFPRPHSNSSRRSPLSRNLPLTHHTPPSDPPSHDYTSTETWGWALLVATWLTFTVGMGSCLDLWSWAWDVGSTPHAPPELEDDPTLPIVGYYPALMVLTGVVAWVWVTVAWVGMKYFRHAKIEV